ncbi:glycosyl hydrolase [Sorangium sp. So ce291]|uniref:glycosyl hydrolase n=1 Tax=Sorangium sp. So ce291 TaxID=3133294 RepID=UPI003F5DC356
MRTSRWSCFVMMVALAGPAGCVLDEAEGEVGIEEDIELDELSGDLSTGTTYTLVGVQSGRCIDVPSRSTADDVALTLWDCNGGTNQQFRFEAADGGHYRIRNVASNKCLDVRGAATADGAAIVQYTCHGNVNQQWAVTDLGGDTLRITSRLSGKSLEAYQAATANGTSVVQWPYSGGAHQRWKLVVPGSGSGGTGGGGTGGTGGGTGGTGGTGGGTSGPEPVSPNASPQARKLLSYIYSQYGNHILSGQHESTWIGGPEYEMNYIHDRTGKYPAIRALDLGDSPTTAASRAIAWWNAGGIPMIGYHMGAPTKPDGYDGSLQSVSINAVLTSGTAENRSFHQRLDLAAAELQKLEDANVAVLWRPFHEAGGTWFWWSKEGGSQYIRLWRYMFDYYTRTKGLTNLVWLHPYNGSPSSSFYPGKAYVDVGGADTYAGDHGPLKGMFDAVRSIVGTTLPIALHENGRIPDPDQLQAQGARWVLFNTWHGAHLTDSNSVSLLQKVYGHSYVVTRDEVPNLK